MCYPSGGVGVNTPGIGNLLFNLTSSLASNATEYYANKDNLKYRTQIALNNAKNAQNEALRQKQLGIDSARLEKIEGIRAANILKAQNSATGLDVSSQTSKYSYEDVYQQADINANLARKEYDLNSSAYFRQANNYLNEVNNYQKSYNNALFNNALNALGKTQKVAEEWYDKKTEEFSFTGVL